MCEAEALRLEQRADEIRDGLQSPGPFDDAAYAELAIIERSAAHYRDNATDWRNVERLIAEAKGDSP